jgi:hypothetical protein
MANLLPMIENQSRSTALVVALRGPISTAINGKRLKRMRRKTKCAPKLGTDAQIPIKGIKMDETGGIMFLGMAVGAVLSGWLFVSHMTWNSSVKSGEEFFLDSAVYSCAVVHTLQKDNTRKSGE